MLQWFSPASAATAIRASLWRAGFVATMYAAACAIGLTHSVASYATLTGATLIVMAANLRWLGARIEEMLRCAEETSRR